MSAAAPAPEQAATTNGDPTSPLGGRRADNVVEIHNLHVHFASRLGTVAAVNGVSLDIPRGRVVGVVGESGCGKSITALAIMQLVPPPGKITAGQILFRPAPAQPPVDVLRYDRNSSEVRAIRGRHVSMIFQEPMTALNPCYTVGDQITETILLHQTRDRKEADARAVDILQRVGLPNPGRLARMYPHELSGGMRQRAMIALALSCEPDLLLADEPTTALDVTTQAQILDVMRELQAQIGMAIMFVTHNLGVIAQMADDVAVMYLGRVVEHAPVDELFDEPRHPYTRALMRSIPQLGVARHSRLHVIAGSVPGAYTQVPGCAFHPRCPAAMDGLCNVHLPVLLPVNPRASVACFLYHQPDGTPAAPAAPPPLAAPNGGSADPGPAQRGPEAPPAQMAAPTGGATDATDATEVQR